MEYLIHMEVISVASNGLIIDAQQLKAKDGNLKIINKNK